MKKYLKIFLIASFSLSIIFSCKKDKQTEENFKIEDYYGKYSGTLIVEAMADDGFIILDKPVTKKIATDITLTPIKETTNGVMVYVSAFNDSVHTEYNNETKRLIIIDKPYSLYLRIKDFPKFNGNWDNAVFTFGFFEQWDNEIKLRFTFDFLKDMNDSVFVCGVTAKKIN
jgi:hypothetical protein